MNVERVTAIISAHYAINGAQGVVCGGCRLMADWSPRHQAQMVAEAESSTRSGLLSELRGLVISWGHRGIDPSTRQELTDIVNRHTHA